MGKNNPSDLEFWRVVIRHSVHSILLHLVARLVDFSTSTIHSVNGTEMDHHNGGKELSHTACLRHTAESL